MLGGYHILTVTHRNVPLRNIAHFVVQESENTFTKDTLASIKEALQLNELLYLATCNRVLYLFNTDQIVDDSFIESFFQTINPSLTSAFISENVQHLHKEKAIQHFFELASSIDSMVVGEREILRQIKSAFKQNSSWGLTGDNIRLLMKYVVPAAKSVYTDTQIGEKSVSVVSLAVQKMLAVNLPTTARILLIGAGQTNTLVSKFLVKYGFANVVVFNRSIERANSLADFVGGEALALDQLKHYKKGFDCLIVCTGATNPIITQTLYKKLLGSDTDKKLVIDLSVPHNVSDEVPQHFNINYIQIEDIKILADSNLSFRQAEVEKAKELLTDYLDEFYTIYQQRLLERAMQNVPQEIKAIKAHAINTVFKKELSVLDDKAKLLLEEMMNYMEKKCISIPMKAAKQTLINS